jgi:endo-1,4-beta-mannosidase
MTTKQPDRRRFLLRLAACGLAVSSLPACTWPATNATTPGALTRVTSNNGKLMANGRTLEIHGVNYVHPTGANMLLCGMLQFGADGNCPWDMGPIERDFARLRELGCNTVRVFLNFYVFGAARETQPAYDLEPALAHLEQFVAAAAAQGIYTIPVLMAKYPQDTFGEQWYQRTLELHIRPVVQRLAGNPAIMMWDLFNEPDIGSPVNIRCWDWDNELEPFCFPMAEERMRFLQVIHDEVKRLDRTCLTTVSMAFAKSYFEPHNAFMRMADLVDVLTFHYYDDEPPNSGRYAQHWYYGQGFPADLERAIRELDALNTTKPIVVTEIGFPTGPQDWRRAADLRRDLRTALDVVRAERAAGMLLWPFQGDPDSLVGDTFR